VFALFATLVLAQNLEPIPPTPYDLVVELVITAGSEQVEGFGPGTFYEYEVEFNGTLHIWTRSQMDLALRVDDVNEGTSLEDDNSGGGDVPYLRLQVEEGDYFAVLVASKGADHLGALELCMIAAPENETTRAAAALVRTALTQEAARFARDGDPAPARKVIATVLAQIEGIASAATSQVLTDLLQNAGQIAHYSGDLTRARAIDESALAGYERTLPDSHPDLLRARGALANSMQEMGDLAGARALQESVLAGFETTLPEDHVDLFAARLNLSASLQQLGDLAGARALHESILTGYATTLSEDHPDVLLVRTHLALSMEKMGDLAGARALKETVLAGYERALPEDHPDLLVARLNLAGSMKRMGDLAGARALFESVLAAYEKTLPRGHPRLLAAQGNLALSMEAMGDLAGARAAMESLVAAFEEARPVGHPDLLLVRMNLARSMEKMGDLAAARALLESVVAEYEKMLPQDHPDLLLAQLNLANSIESTGDLALARTLHESLLAGYERTLREGHPDLLVARANLAGSMLRMDDLAGARALLPKLVAGMRARVLASLSLAPRQARQTVESESLRLSQVLLLSEAAGPEPRRNAFELTETMRLVAAEAARSLVRSEMDPELAPILGEAAEVRRALNDLVAGAALESMAADEFSAKLTKLSLQRDRLELQASQLLADRGVVTQPVGTQALAAALNSGEAAVGYRRVTQWGLGDTSGTIEAGADHLLAHVLTPEGTLNRIDLGPASELEGLAGAWRAAMGAPLMRGLSVEVSDDVDPELEAGDRLRARVLDPVLARAGEDVERLFVCADDLLFLLPLDALPVETDAEDGSSADGSHVARLGDRVHIVNEVSFARLLAPAGPLKSAPSLLAFGGVDFDAAGAVPEGLAASSAPIEAGDEDQREDGFDPGRDGPEAGGVEHVSTSRSALPERFQRLLQTRYEAEAAADLFEEAFEIEASLLTRKATTKAALFESAAGKRYLHVATHGWFAPESVRSTEGSQPARHGFARMGIEERVSGLAPMTLCGLALAGANTGRDSLGRVPGILTAEELCSLDLSQCELAVLSACETNVGIRRAGQGIQSLQSALYAAGARTSITSLWKVDDAATRKLFELFYTYLWVEKMEKADALWTAKMAMRSARHPARNWAGWVLTGDPD